MGLINDINQGMGDAAEASRKKAEAEEAQKQEAKKRAEQEAKQKKEDKKQGMI